MIGILFFFPSWFHRVRTNEKWCRGRFRIWRLCADRATASHHARMCASGASPPRQHPPPSLLGVQPKLQQVASAVTARNKLPNQSLSIWPQVGTLSKDGFLVSAEPLSVFPRESPLSAEILRTESRHGLQSIRPHPKVRMKERERERDCCEEVVVDRGKISMCSFCPVTSSIIAPGARVMPPRSSTSPTKVALGAIGVASSARSALDPFSLRSCRARLPGGPCSSST